MGSTRKFSQWIEEEATKKSEFQVAYGTPAQEMMLDFWKEFRPIMFKALQKRKLHKKMAKVFEQKALEQIAREEGSMPHFDIREQAERDWYLMEPEEPDEYPNGKYQVD